MAFFVRCMALWGPRALERAALACVELQMARQTRCSADIEPLRDAAMAAVRRHAQHADDEARASAHAAAQACFEWWEPRHDDDPDALLAREHWCQLGAPWFAAQFAADDLALTSWDGEPPRGASATWGNRNRIWLSRAADAASAWCSIGETQQAMHAALLAWVQDPATAERDLG